MSKGYQHPKKQVNINSSNELENKLQEFKSDPKIEVLSIIYDASIEDMAKVTEILHENHNISVFAVSTHHAWGGFKLDSEKLHILTEALKTNTSLTKLQFNACGIDTEGAKLLAKMLEENTSLQSLKISNSEIGDKGTEYLANSLKTNTSLKELFLITSQISTGGVSALADSLETNKTLLSLHLGGNNILAKATITFFEALEKMSLTELSWTHTAECHNNNSLNAIYNGLSKNQSLERVFLEGAGIQVNEQLAEALEKNSTLVYLDIAYQNSNKSELYDKITGILKSNEEALATINIKPVKSENGSTHTNNDYPIKEEQEFGQELNVIEQIIDSEIPETDNAVELAEAPSLFDYCIIL